MFWLRQGRNLRRRSRFPGKEMMKSLDLSSPFIPPSLIFSLPHSIFPSPLISLLFPFPCLYRLLFPHALSPTSHLPSRPPCPSILLFSLLPLIFSFHISLICPLSHPPLFSFPHFSHPRPSSPPFFLFPHYIPSSLPLSLSLFHSRTATHFLIHFYISPIYKHQLTRILSMITGLHPGDM